MQRVHPRHQLPRAALGALPGTRFTLAFKLFLAPRVSTFFGQGLGAVPARLADPAVPVKEALA